MGCISRHITFGYLLEDHTVSLLTGVSVRMHNQELWIGKNQ